MELCGAKLQAVGGATDGTEWECELVANHVGPHRRAWLMQCAVDGDALVCTVTWDWHPAHPLVNV